MLSQTYANRCGFDADKRPCFQSALSPAVFCIPANLYRDVYLTPMLPFPSPPDKGGVIYDRKNVNLESQQVKERHSMSPTQRHPEMSIH